jgi:hypothetical protein
MITQTLFTFISEVADSTVVEQATGSGLIDAVRQWAKSSAIQPQLNEDVMDIDATPLVGVAHVWCVTGLTATDDVFITHVIKTSPSMAAV